MSKQYLDHFSEIVLDFGVIGEQYVDVQYDWHEPNPSNDPFQPPEKGGADIKDVLLFVDGKEVSVFHWLSASTLDDVADLIREHWL